MPSSSRRFRRVRAANGGLDTRSESRDRTTLLCCHMCGKLLHAAAVYLAGIDRMHQDFALPILAQHHTPLRLSRALLHQQTQIVNASD